MGGSLPRRITDSGLLDLPQEFVEYMKDKGKQCLEPEELVKELKDWQKSSASVVSEEDREFIRDELAWLAEWIRSRYPKLNFCDIRRFLTEMVSVSV
ncbi:MAG: hypothetical protein QXG58_06220 [Candidatus Bathyarchaeia archaeon]